MLHIIISDLLRKVRAFCVDQYTIISYQTDKKYYKTRQRLRCGRNIFIFMFYVTFLDPPVRVAVDWPEGQYGLPREVQGCPLLPGLSLGSYKHSFRSEISTETKLSMDNGRYTRHRFCMAQNNNDKAPEWPKGTYCIYKKTKCPNGITYTV